MTYRPLAHIIGDVVKMVRDDFTPEKVIPFYDYGTTIEVVNRLKRKTESPEWEYKKYPLIWYVIDGSVKESVENNKSAVRTVSNCSLIICTQTLSELTSEERYAQNFIPVLRPIYEAFFFQLKKSNLLKSSNYFNHTCYENLFWGKEGLYGHQGNIFDDRLDAIIIDNLELSIIEKC